VWVGGALSALRSDRLELKEPFGSVVILHRLAGNATTFFEVRDGAWEQVDPQAARVGSRACVETLMNGKVLLALRVFVGAECGPATSP
jgi:hypothetical protein